MFTKYKDYDQFVAMSFGHLNKIITLSDISSGIGVSEIFIKDLGLSQSPARSTMSDGNKKRNWKVYELLYNELISEDNLWDGIDTYYYELFYNELISYYGKVLSSMLIFTKKSRQYSRKRYHQI